MARRLPGFVLALVLVAGVPGARAQQTSFTITVRDNGQPVANAALSVVLNGIKRPTEAVSDENGEMVVSGVAIAPGTRTTVYVRRCDDGEVTLVAVPEGERADVACADEDAEVGRRCSCRRLALILFWGRDTVIEVSGGGTAGTPGRVGPDVTIGIKADGLFWTKLEDVCGGDAGASCDPDGSSPLMGGFLEVGFARALLAGVSAFYAFPVDFRQTFDGRAVDGEMKAFIVDLYGGARWRVSPRVSLLALLGWSWIRNEADFSTDDGTLNKDESGGRGRVGAALDAFLSDRVGIRLNVDYRSGGNDDADTSVAAGGGIVLRLGGKEGGR